VLLRYIKFIYYFWIALPGILSAQSVLPDTSRNAWYREWELKIKDVEKKIQLYTTQIDSAEDDWARYYRGVAYLTKGYFRQAESDLLASLNFPKRTINPAWPYTMLAQKAYLLAEYKLAIRNANLAIEAYDSLAAAWRIRARTHLALGNSKQAFEDLQQAIRLDPANPENLWERSGISLAKEDYASCLNDLNLLLKAEPSRIDYKTRKAWCLYQLGNDAEVMKMLPGLKNASIQDPVQNSALADLMFVYQELQEAERLYSQAIQYYESQIYKDPSYATRNKKVIHENYLYRGMVRMDAKKFREALIDYTSAVTMDPKDYRTHLCIGELQTMQGNYRDAITAYEQTMRLNPTLKEGWVNYGYCYDQLGRYKEAINVFTKGLQRDSSNCLLYNNRGFTYLNIRMLDKALTDIQMAVALCHEEMMPKVSLGEYYYLLDKHDEALIHLNAALNTKDGSEAAIRTGYFVRGKVWLKKRELVKSRQDLEKAFELDPKNAEVAETLGLALYRMEKFCEALGMFRKALSLDVDNDTKKAPNSTYYISMIHEIVVKGCP
jgi:tetratricopeptide (TPR) repeat protein